MSESANPSELSTSLSPLRRAFRKALMTAARRAVRKAEKLADELAACDDAERLRECGELIKANLDRVERGAASVTLPDLYHPGTDREIPLETHLKPLDNARRYFKQAAKREKGAAHIAEQLERCRDECAALGDLLDALTAWEDEAPADAQPPETMVSEARRLRIHVAGLEAKPEKSNKHAPPRGVRRFRSHDGMTIYVGKNASDNDYLSFRIARGNDWWFHAAHVSGSHVVVRNDRRGAPLPQETLLDAAHLAVYYSKMRRASRADVTYAQAKALRKAKRSPAGQVTVQNGSNLGLRIEPERLQRLLDGEREDEA